MLKHFFFLGFIFLLVHGWAQFGQEEYDEMLKKEYKGTIPCIQPKALYEALQAGEQIHLLDTREEQEYNVSFIQGAAQVGFLFFRKGKVKAINKSDKIVVYCTIGARSETIGTRLKKYGFTNVYNLYGGIIQWKNLGYPVVNLANKETKDVHVYSKTWGQWLRKGNPRY